MRRWWTPTAPPRWVASMLALAAVFGASMPAAASPASVSVTGGGLGVAAPEVSDFAVVVLNGSVQATEAALDAFTVTDARGSGQGWALEIRATLFREWDGTTYVAGAKILPEGSLQLQGLTVTAAAPDAVVPTVAPGPYLLDGAAVTVATAEPGVGMGRFVFHATGALRVEVSADAYARTYRSELSISVTSGP